LGGNGLGVRNVRFKVEYDGTDFRGWQRQPKVRTVEGDLAKALSGLLGSEPEIIAAARTDSGVHALGQVVNFSCVVDMGPEELMNAANAHLAPDVRVTEAREVPLAFNARFDALRRVYRYEISTRPTSVWRRHRWYVKWDLDVGTMNDAIKGIVGDNDFSAFTCKDEDRSAHISMKEAWAKESEHHVIEVVVAANRFLRRMVRMITGTLVEVGRGKMSPDDVADLLTRAERATAGPCAPPHGLYLVAVQY
jgi:tRNA pseudouridine38-40 synthase